MTLKSLLAAAVLAALPTASFASGFNWNAALASDYLYRGIDQNDDQPAIQLGAGFAFEGGLYVGAWGSNVDFRDGTDTEIDTFIGWAGDVADGTTLNVQLVRYNYLNEPAGVDYAFNELITTLGVGENYSFTLGYTNDYLNLDETSLYYAVGGSWGFANDYTFGANVGYTTISGFRGNFFDYGVNVSRDFGPVNVALGYVGTSSGAEDTFLADDAEEKVTLIFSIEG